MLGQALKSPMIRDEASGCACMTCAAFSSRYCVCSARTSSAAAPMGSCRWVLNTYADCSVALSSSSSQVQLRM